jgi:hypothetical protein
VPILAKHARSVFASKMLLHTLRDRASRDHGDPSARVSPMFSAWTDGLFTEIRSEVGEYVQRSGLRLHRDVAAVYSSMAFAFNLFAPFRLQGASALAGILGQATSRSLEVESIDFELHGQSDVLGEWTEVDRPGPEDKFTAADVGVVVRDGTRRGIILIEVKLGEGGFTNCKGRTSPENRDPDVCKSASAFLAEPRRCYLTRTVRAVRDRRYWDIFAAQSGTVAAMFPNVPADGGCPFAYNNQQPMRNQAMALGLVQAGEFDFAHFGLVHHDKNPDVPTQWASYRGLFRDDRMLFILKATEVLAEGPSVAWWRTWRQYMLERYDLRPLGVAA